MRTTTLIALIGTCAAAATAETDCKVAGSKTCTAALCFVDKKIQDTKTYLSCAQFDTDADKCQYGDATSCTSKICDAKTWTNCATCQDKPQTATCWSDKDASDKCHWTGVGCTAAICADHEVDKKVSTTPAATKAGAAWSAKYWSDQCTFTQVQNLRLTPVTDTAGWTKVHDKTTSDLATATSTQKTACPKSDTATAACTSAKTDLTKQTAYTAANTTWFSVAKQDLLQTNDLKNCKAEDSSATCDALKKTTNAAYAKAETASTTAAATYKTCDTKTYKPVKTADELKTFCAADLKAKTDAATKEAQVKVWNTDVDAALTNNYDAVTQKWLGIWFKEKFTSAKTKAETDALKKTANDNFTAAKAAWDTAKTDVKTTLTTQTSTEAADKAKSDAATKQAMDAAKTAHTAALATETAANKKQLFLQVWSKYADTYMTLDWENAAEVAKHFDWMKNGMEMSALKTDAEKLQTKNTADLKAAEAADDAASTAATKAKVAGLKTWVAAGDKILTNSWDKDTYAQDWQFTWFKNECEALKTKDEMEKQQVKLTYDQTMTKKSLADAMKLQTSTDKEVTAAKAIVTKKTADRETARAGKEGDAADKLAWGSAVKALANAEMNQQTQETAHTNAVDAVAQWTAKDAVLATWLTWANERLDNTYQAWQVTWMTNKISGMNSKSSAEAVQTANIATLAAHTTSAKTATGAAKTTLDSQITQETSWVASGKAALADADNLNTWHTNGLKAARTVKSTEALLTADTAACTAAAGSQACTWKVADAAQLKTLKAEKVTRDAAHDKASTVVKANQFKDEGKTKEEARAELAKLNADSTAASHALEETAASIKSNDCAVTNADTITCEDLARTYDAQATALKAAKAAVTAQEAWYKTHDFPRSSDTLVAITILCVSAFVCITGGCIWNHHEKKVEAAAAEKRHADITANEAKTGDMENKGEEAVATAVNDFYNDDSYKAMAGEY